MSDVVTDDIGVIRKAMALRVKYRITEVKNPCRIQTSQLGVHIVNRGGVYPQCDVVRGLGNNLLDWGFIAMDGDGKVVASAKTVPPPWNIDIPGAEAWAILEAATIAESGSDFRVDCAPCVTAIHRCRAWATSAKRPLARIFSMVFINEVRPSSA